jgi:DNA-binding protein
LTGTDDDIIDTIKAYEAAGLDEIVVGATTADVNRNIDAMSHVMERISPKL